MHNSVIWLSKVHNRAAHMFTVLAKKYDIEIGKQWDLHKEGRAWDKDKNDEDFAWAKDVAEVAKCASDSKKALDKLIAEGDTNDQQFLKMYQESLDVVNSFSTLEAKADENSSQAMIDFCVKFRPYH